MLVKCPCCGKEFDFTRRMKKNYGKELFACMSLAVVNATGYGMKMLRSKSRKRDLVDVRTCVVMILRESGVEAKIIGEFVNRDYSDVSWLCKRFSDQKSELENIYNDINDEMERLQVSV